MSVRILILITLFGFFRSEPALAQVVFSKSNYDSLRLDAIQNKKLLFVDFTAVWCRPCLEMDQKTFVDESLGTYINHQFATLKTDIDHPEGDSLRKQFTVFQYPTILILNPYTEEVVLRLIGFKPAGILFDDLKAMRRPEGYPEL
ncbi:MAG: thioredoxin family protein [Flavobacteriales bacterium]|nr:thioredoxin family protein [Flavobacteriales bacterium]